MFKKEVIIFVVIFLLLALMMHMDAWLTHPLEQLNRLSTHAMPYHPLLYTIIAYLCVALIRFSIHSIQKLFRRK